ncbi:MAG: DUF3472 domain-containing protein [Verrucomicrobia bacterium]|nr:DUF3472 domain-containing protein [Verrucomicrobiota bacterium]
MRTLTVLTMLWIAGVGLPARAASAAPSTTPSPITETSSVTEPSAARPSPGVQAAQAISTITGVAISPLLGVSAVGAWTYLRAAPEERARVPWYGRPWFWIPGLLVVGVCFAKDVMGPAVPLALKKPMDAIELFENKLSGLIVAGAFVPLVATVFQAVSSEGAWFPGAGLAMADPRSLVNLLTVPVAIACFGLVWMASHVVNVLIVISPFATLDAALKSARFFLLSTVAATAFADPYVGAAWSVVLVVAAYFLAGWSFRLTVFGSVFAFDLLTLRHKRFAPKPGRTWAFTARKLGTVPVRTYGRLTPGQDRLTLRYRPWMVLPARTAILPSGPYVMERGLLNPGVIQDDGGKHRSLVLLPPRYRTHERAVTESLGLGDVRDAAIVRGMRAVWQWLKALLGSGAKVALAAALVMAPAGAASAAAPPAAPRAARSVHWGWQGPEGEWFHTAMAVDESVPGSYFMAAGWNTGYFGIQELGNGRKVILFSVWDPTRGDNPAAVKPEDRVECLHSDPEMRIRRFGGEGTGGQCMGDFDWQLGQTNRFLVRGAVQGNTTAYAGYVWMHAARQWRHLVTFRTRTGGQPLKGYYSFIEDFRRDTRSAQQRRRARFGNAWVNSTAGDWVPLLRARFTASTSSWEAQDTINAGLQDGWFFLETGGHTTNQLRLRSLVEQPPFPLPRLDTPPPAARTSSP